MTREEIINEIKPLLEELNYPNAVSYLTQNDVKWLNENIKALEQQPCDNAISRQDVFNKIRAEIADEKIDFDLDIGQEIHYNRAIDDVLAIIDKYIGEVKE